MSEPAGVWKYLRGLESYSLCDWPGVPSCVLFMGSCNLRCPTCHNYKLAWNMTELPVLPAYRLKTFLAERAKWLEGVTVTGGEPTFVPGIGELLWEVGKFGLPIKLDTNGMRPDMVRELLDGGLVKKFAVDVKGPFHKYPELTGDCVTAGVAENNIRAIFEMAATAPESFYFRTTRVPLLTDDDLDTVRAYLPHGFDLIIQEYVAPRREEHAVADHEERRSVGDLVH